MNAAAKQIDINIDNFDEFFTRDYARSLVMSFTRDENGEVNIPNESYWVRELVRWVERHNTDETEYTIYPVVAAMILDECVA